VIVNAEAAIAARRGCSEGSCSTSVGAAVPCSAPSAIACTAWAMNNTTTVCAAANSPAATAATKIAAIRTSRRPITSDSGPNASTAGITSSV